MIKTIIILILTLIIIPLVSFYFGEPLTPLQTSILWNSVYICFGVAMGCFILSEATKNNSQVDKIWSVVPIVYAWYIAYAGGMNDRLILMAVLVSIWGIRLTYNFSRRGAYTWKFWAGEEDYRWKVLREKPELKGRTRWFFFNLFFISIYQNALILLFTLPILLAVNENPVPLNWLDYVASAAFILFVVIETIADQQQWNYQQEKHRKINAGETLDDFYSKGFTHTGLWKLMRHPNYFGEQSVWISFYFLSVAATGEWINWSLAGALLLVILFQGSSDFSEGISLGKYPGYAEYKKKTGRFIPKFW
jgi:steroid 5-alpha reductase family enzyme